jgi:hypothetical protein
MKKAIAIALALLFTAPLFAQEVVTCSAEKTFWYIPGSGATNFSLALEATPKPTDLPHVIVVNGFVLQCLVLDTGEYIEEGGENDETSLLVRHVQGESQYMADAYEGDFNMQLQLEDLPGGQKALYWFFDVPDASLSIKRQHFIEIVAGNKIFGLASSQFEGANPETIKALLVSTLGSLTIVENKSSVCK